MSTHKRSHSSYSKEKYESGEAVGSRKVRIILSPVPNNEIYVGSPIATHEIP